MVETQNTQNVQNAQRKNPIPLVIIVGCFIVAGALLIVNGDKVRGYFDALSARLRENNQEQNNGEDQSQNQNQNQNTNQNQGSVSYEEKLAKCLTEKGVKFYGAYWCGHCKNQKDMFKDAVKYVPYIECIDEKTGGLIKECEAAGIEAFPTWILADGTKQMGEIPLSELAQLTGCPAN